VPPERVERKLAAILAADVAGFSRLMGLDEEGTLARLKAVRKAVVDPAIASHRGRIVKTTGDGMLVEFASAVDAVRGAVEVQRGMAEQNASVPQDQRIEFRIGIHVGDIIVDENDIFGDGVNIAARLEGIAEPGGVCISDDAQRQIRGKVDIAFEDMGSQNLKNIAEPMRAWRLKINAGGCAAAPMEPPVESTQALVLPDKPSIAVLPFDNLGGDADIEGFCDGLSEDLITTLSGTRWVHVVSRKSSFAYKGLSPNIRQVAQELGVNYVLEGSVRRAGERVRINAQLINARSGNHAWARRYDHDFRNPFELQDEVIRDIVGALDYALWYGLARGASGVDALDPKASPLRAAAWHVTQLTATDLRSAVAAARHALERNPRSVAAFQYIVIAHTHAIMCGWSDDPLTDVAAAVEAGRQAVALSPADALSHALFGHAKAAARDGDGAIASGRRALSIDGNSANVLAAMATVLSLAGGADEANDVIARVLDLAPAHYYRSALLSHTALNWLRLGAPERGLSCAEEAVKLKPQALCGHVACAAVLAAVDRAHDAQAALARAVALKPHLDHAFVEAMIAYSDPTDAERFRVSLRAAGLKGSGALCA
jgi:adenylate cyclase